ncbi:MAG: FKBP-type peptidyl-prolyl cis-trans isomerase [Ferruginibacter sp.]
MKKVLSIFLLLGSCAGAAAQTSPKKKFTPPVIKPAFKNLMDSFSYAIGYNIATNLKGQGVAKLNLDIVRRAMEESYKGKPSVLTADLMNTAMQKQMDAFAGANAKPEIDKGREFLNNNRTRKEVITLPSGLQYEVLEKSDTGTVHPKETDTVVVNYIGTLIGGKEFDNSYTYGKPATFTVNRVIRGWTEALQRMVVGDKWKVYIPTELAYNLNPRDPKTIPPGAMLIFEIKLEAIKPAQ